MRGHSPNITKAVENTIVFIKSRHPNMTAKEIHEDLRQHYEIYNLAKRQIPKVRSIQNKLKKPKNKETLERIKNDPLSRHWNISLGRKYGISAQVVPILIHIKQIENDNRDKLPDELTIREAQWVEYLYPALNEILIRQRRELDPEERIWRIYFIAREYAKAEEMCEIKAMEKTTSISIPDTPNLDTKFLIEEDISDDSIADFTIHRQVYEFLRPKINIERIANIREQPITKSELEPFFGRFSQKFAKRLNASLRKAARDLEKYKEDLEKEG
jgi:hypothetical protein